MKRVVLPAVIFISALIVTIAVLWLLPVKSDVIGGKVKIATTIFPIYDISKRVGGDKVDVVRILPSGASPHTFELTSSKIKELQGSRIVFKIGGIDDWADGVAESLDAEKVALRDGIAVRDFSVETIGDEEEKGGGDPHYWMTMRNAIVMAGEVEKKLSDIDPENAAYYAANLNEFKKDALAADLEIRDILKRDTGRSIIAFHGAWNYFAEEYGLKVAASFEPSPGKEPSAAHLRALADLVKREGIKVVFSEPAFSDASLRSFMSDSGLKLYVLHPEDGSSPGASYIDTMISNARIIDQALNDN